MSVKSNLSDEILKILQNYNKQNFPNQINKFLNRQKKVLYHSRKGANSY